jgi:hypothetical protein
MGRALWRSHHARKELAHDGGVIFTRRVSGDGWNRVAVGARFCAADFALQQRCRSAALLCCSPRSDRYTMSAVNPMAVEDWLRNSGPGTSRLLLLGVNGSFLVRFESVQLIDLVGCGGPQSSQGTLTLPYRLRVSDAA